LLGNMPFVCTNTVRASEAWLFGIDDAMENLLSSDPISTYGKYAHQPGAFGTNNWWHAHRKSAVATRQRFKNGIRTRSGI
jgi:hypothetical protein